MSEIDEIYRDLMDLRQRVSSVQIATIAEGSPEASHAPCVWVDDRCHLFLSDLSSHTRNLRRNPAIGLVLVDDDKRANAFARKRLTVQGKVEEIARGTPASDQVLAEFRRRFGQVMDLMEPLADFHLFRVDADSGSFIRGFGQAYRLTGERLDQMEHIDPRK